MAVKVNVLVAHLMFLWCQLSAFGAGDLSPHFSPHIEANDTEVTTLPVRGPAVLCHYVLYWPLMQTVKTGLFFFLYSQHCVIHCDMKQLFYIYATTERHGLSKLVTAVPALSPQPCLNNMVNYLQDVGS